MKNILKRLFVIFPYQVFIMIIALTVLIPFIYWVLTGKNLYDWIETQLY